MTKQQQPITKDTNTIIKEVLAAIRWQNQRFTIAQVEREFLRVTDELYRATGFQRKRIAKGRSPTDGSDINIDLSDGLFLGFYGSLLEILGAERDKVGFGYFICTNDADRAVAGLNDEPTSPDRDDEVAFLRWQQQIRQQEWCHRDLATEEELVQWGQALKACGERMKWEARWIRERAAREDGVR